jgi:hypothetical protein
MTRGAAEPPWLGLDVLSRDRFIGRGYRDALRKVAPELCDVLDRYATDHGITWMLTHREPGDGSWLSRSEVAALAGVKPDTVTKWTDRGLLPRHPEGYHPGQVKAFIAQPVDQRRSIKHSDQLDL